MFKSRLSSLLMVACLAVGMSAVVSGCGTGLGGSTSAASDPAASTPATSHFKADLAVGYGLLGTVEIGAKDALQAGKITKAQAMAVLDQRTTFKATLDSLKSLGETPATDDILAQTVNGIRAAITIVQATQGKP